MEGTYSEVAKSNLLLKKVQDLKDLAEQLSKLEESPQNVELFYRPVKNICGTFNQ